MSTRICFLSFRYRVFSTWAAAYDLCFMRCQILHKQQFPASAFTERYILETSAYMYTLPLTQTHHPEGLLLITACFLSFFFYSWCLCGDGAFKCWGSSTSFMFSVQLLTWETLHCSKNLDLYYCCGNSKYLWPQNGTQRLNSTPLRCRFGKQRNRV